MSKIKIILDGVESGAGRATFLISSLYFCADWITKAELIMINASDESVVIASQSLYWDVGIKIDLREAENGINEQILTGASLYAGVAFRSAEHMCIAEARSHGVPTLVAIQFPDPDWFSASTMLREDVAFDTRALSCHLKSIILPWL